MKRKQYTTPDLQPSELGLELLLATSSDGSGADMPIDDIELTFN